MLFRQKLALTNERIGRSCLVLLSFVALSSRAMAQTINQDGMDTLSSSSSEDLASAFISFLFGSGDSSDNALFSSAHLSSVAEAMRHALAVYSVGMLVLGGFLLFYHIAVMIAETAHQGVVMGRKTNQIWAPIRLIFAIILLVPIGSGLSVGQHIVLKIASSGSHMASHAWDTLSASLHDSFYSLVTPRGPDLSNFITVSVEMELCRDIYEQMHAAQASSPGIKLAGDISEIEKIAATSMTPETWRYTNPFNANIPMCGEYRFSGYRHHSMVNTSANDGVAHIADDIAQFSHAEAEATLAQARMFAGYAAPSFNGNDLAPLPGMRDDLTSMRRTLQQQMDNHLLTLSAAQKSLAGKYFPQGSSAGWITAAFFIPDLVRLQESYGELVNHMLPDVQEPVFIHRGLTQQVMQDAFLEDPILHDMGHDITDDLARFYGRVSHSNMRAEAWLNKSQNDIGFVTNSDFDLRDQVNAATDSAATFSLFAHTIDTAALNRGVWGHLGSGQDAGNPFAFPAHMDNYNLLTALIEFGHRQFDLGIYLIGMAGSFLSVPQIMAPAILAMILGGFFIAGGLALVFLIPLLPFVRFLLAVLVWLVELLEALVAMPLVALAHLTPSGDGLSGSAARQAYLLWISLAIRPVLSVFGLVAGALILALGLFILLIAFTPLAQLAALTNSGILIVANTGLVLTYDILVYAIANVAFRGINTLPDHALRWISPFVVTENAVVLQSTGASSTTVTASAPVTALVEKMAAYASGNSAASARSTSSSSATTQGHSSLFPVYRNETEGMLPTQKEAKKSNTSVTGHMASPISTTVSLTNNLPSRDLDKDKKKDKNKDQNKEDPFIEKPVFKKMDLKDNGESSEKTKEAEELKDPGEPSN